MFSGLNDPLTWSLPNALLEMAGTRPDAVWIRTAGPMQMTYGEAAHDAGVMAGFLAASGVHAGDFVLVMMPSDLDFVRVWAGLGRLGAVAVLLNTELNGPFLAHQLRNSYAKLALVHPRYLASVESAMADAPRLKTIIVTGARAGCQRQADGGCAVIDWQDWQDAPSWNGPLPAPSDIATVMFTSGTSGPSKGVLMTHTHCTAFGVGMIQALEVRSDDVYYITLPLFHANGLFMQLGTSLLAGIPAFVRPRFSASVWLSDVLEQGATITHMLGTTAAFVISRPPTAGDKAHRLRAMLNAPNVPEHERVFRERFGVRDVISGYGMTEVGNPVIGHIGVSAPGAAGWVDQERYEVQIVDPQTDLPVPHGEVGEIVVRPKIPFCLMAGYHGMPEQTTEAWRNLWFHTGDAGTMNRSGLVVFVDRIKDCIRRRGENISGTEVEMAVSAIPGVGEVAAYAVPSDIAGAEDEIMLAIVAEAGCAPSPHELGRQADALLPKFAQPRFIRLMEALPKTATGKVQRAELRRQGSQMAFDRQNPHLPT